MSDDEKTTEEITITEKISPHLTAAAEFGMSFRPITGHVLRRAKQLGLDMDELGRSADDPEIAEDEYYDQIVTAAWLLCEDEARIREATVGGGDADIAREIWQDEYLTSIAAEAAMMRAFIARWMEYRLEMDRVFGGEEEATEA